MSNQHARFPQSPSYRADKTLDLRDPKTVQPPNPQQPSASSPGPGGRLRTILPDELLAKYLPLRNLNVLGGQADLVLCRERDTGVPRVIKLYRNAAQLDFTVLERIHQADPAHVVGLLAHGQTDGEPWEVLEYCAGGTLTDYRARQSEPRDKPGHLRQVAPHICQDVLSQLAEAIRHIHQLGITHRDLKPENVLVVAEQPLNVVLSDFGVATEQVATMQVQTVAASWPWAAPEVHVQGVVSQGIDWWALGAIMHQLLTGRHILADADGRLPSDNQLRTLIIQGHYSADAVPQPRWRNLISGLLTYDPARRWGYSEVTSWLAGKEPHQAEPLLHPPRIESASPRPRPALVHSEAPTQIEALRPQPAPTRIQPSVPSQHDATLSPTPGPPAPPAPPSPKELAAREHRARSAGLQQHRRAGRGRRLRKQAINRIGLSLGYSVLAGTVATFLRYQPGVTTLEDWVSYTWPVLTACLVFALLTIALDWWLDDPAGAPRRLPVAIGVLVAGEALWRYGTGALQGVSQDTLLLITPASLGIGWLIGSLFSYALRWLREHYPPNRVSNALDGSLLRRLLLALAVLACLSAVLMIFPTSVALPTAQLALLTLIAWVLHLAAPAVAHWQPAAGLALVIASAIAAGWVIVEQAQRLALLVL